MNYLVFILSTLQAVSGLHKAFGCKYHQVLIYSTSLKPGEFKICYRNKQSYYKPELSCPYQNKNYKEGDTIVDGCKVCYCTEHEKMICVTLCHGENQKAVMKPQPKTNRLTPPRYCAIFTHKVLCKPLKNEPTCEFQDQTVSEGIFFGKYGIFACSEKGKPSNLALYPSLSCGAEQPIGCQYKGQTYFPGPFKNGECECKDDGTVICKEKETETPVEPKKAIMCDYEGGKVPVGPIENTDCTCTEKGVVSCLAKETTGCRELPPLFCIHNQTIYPTGPIPGTNCNCTTTMSVVCKPDIQLDEEPICQYNNEWHMVGPISDTGCNCTPNGEVKCKNDHTDGCLYNDKFVPVGAISNSNCTCKNNSIVKCRDMLPEPTDTLPEPTDTLPEPTDTLPEPTDTLPEPTVKCSYNGKQYGVGRMKGTPCTCKDDGEVVCDTPEQLMFDFPKENVCSYNGTGYPLGPIPDTTCVCLPNGSVDCEKKLLVEADVPDDCRFKDKFYGVGPIPGENCTCTESGYVDCPMKRQCEHNGKLVPLGKIEGEECFCQEVPGKDMGDVYCKRG